MPGPSTNWVQIWALEVDLDKPANSTLSQEPGLTLSESGSNLCAPITGFCCHPQPEGVPDLDPLRDVVRHRPRWISEAVARLVTSAPVSLGRLPALR
jgi:hypothetical protein